MRERTLRPRISFPLNTGTWIVLLIVMLKLIVEYYSSHRHFSSPALCVGLCSSGLKITRAGFQEVLNYGLAELHRGHWIHTTQHGGNSFLDFSTTLDSWAHVVYRTRMVNMVHLLHCHGCYLCLIEVFDTNTVHDSSKRPGSLCLLVRKSGSIYYLQKTGTQAMRVFLPLCLVTRAVTAAVLELRPLAVQWWAGVPAALRLSVQ